MVSWAVGKDPFSQIAKLNRTFLETQSQLLATSFHCGVNPKLYDSSALSSMDNDMCALDGLGNQDSALCIDFRRGQG